jgi:hypothetical protein
LEEIDQIVDCLTQVYKIEKVYEDFDVVENERVVTNPVEAQTEEQEV